MIRIMDGTDERHVGIRVDGRNEDDSVGAARSLVALLEESIEKRGPIRVLLQLESLGEIEPGAFIESLKFSLSNLKDIERTALVGEQAWLGPYARAVDTLFPSDTRAFQPAELSEAWSWLREAAPAEQAASQ